MRLEVGDRLIINDAHDKVNRMVVVDRIWLVGVSVSMYRAIAFHIWFNCESNPVGARLVQCLCYGANLCGLDAEKCTCNSENRNHPGLQS